MGPHSVLNATREGPGQMCAISKGPSYGAICIPSGCETLPGSKRAEIN